MPPHAVGVIPAAGACLRASACRLPPPAASVRTLTLGVTETGRKASARRRMTLLCQASSKSNCKEQSPPGAPATVGRRELASMAAAAAAAAALPAAAQDFVTTPSGLKVLQVRSGEGERPRDGDTVVVYWTGVTAGYRQHRIDDPQVKEREPYVFKLGAHQAIPAFEEAVGAMRVGDVVRIEVEGKYPELGYPADRKRRFVDDKFLVYSMGPQPTDLGGQRALDFVLDSTVLQDFNKTLVFDIRLLSVRKSQS